VAAQLRERLERVDMHRHGGREVRGIPNGFWDFL
jgi:hypothetical protein